MAVTWLLFAFPLVEDLETAEHTLDREVPVNDLLYVRVRLVPDKALRRLFLTVTVNPENVTRVVSGEDLSLTEVENQLPHEVGLLLELLLDGFAFSLDFLVFFFGVLLVLLDASVSDFRYVRFVKYFGLAGIARVVDIGTTPWGLRDLREVEGLVILARGRRPRTCFFRKFL